MITNSLILKINISLVLNSKNNFSTCPVLYADSSENNPYKDDLSKNKGKGRALEESDDDSDEKKPKLDKGKGRALEESEDERAKVGALYNPSDVIRVRPVNQTDSDIAEEKERWINFYFLVKERTSSEIALYQANVQIGMPPPVDDSDISSASSSQGYISDEDLREAILRSEQDAKHALESKQKESSKKDSGSDSDSDSDSSNPNPGAGSSSSNPNPGVGSSSSAEGSSNMNSRNKLNESPLSWLEYFLGFLPSTDTSLEIINLIIKALTGDDSDDDHFS